MKIENKFLTYTLLIGFIICFFITLVVGIEYRNINNNEEIINSTVEQDQFHQKMIFLNTEKTLYQLKKEYNKISKVEDRFLIDVPIINKSKEFPSGDEIISSVVLLKYIGYNITKEEFLKKYISYDISETKIKDKIYRGNPNEFYIGNPLAENSIGCNASVIEKSLNNYFKDIRSFDKAISLENPSREDLTALLQYGIPVMVFVTKDMREPAKYNQWYIKNTNNKFSWADSFSTLVLCGYDDENFYFSSTEAPNEYVKFNQIDFIKIFKIRNSQAIIISRN